MEEEAYCCLFRLAFLEHHLREFVCPDTRRPGKAPGSTHHRRRSPSAMSPLPTAPPSSASATP
ncbi:hypothetical protein E2562_008849 [Oryza meyeriana var. granulata]|uniref:Uncharacterized protein n=1 Tax=Oryza meyeriana var. granulata TaxID=110450 RepID=A0A6G1D0E7_9ORYZ|nr:hypothetical protein E2562_008074 [Oryza meyeriana var. granulata]KAF0905797.1 hypothetical protein E2562_008849 [Oryza meyeriana var. granulata]